MSEEPVASHWFLERIGWDGPLPLVAIGSRAVLAFLISDMAAIGIVVLLVIPMVAIGRAQLSRKAIQRFGLEKAYGRQILFAGAIITLTICEIAAVYILTDTEAPLLAWLIAAGLYAFYAGLIAIALRPVRQKHKAS